MTERRDFLKAGALAAMEPAAIGVFDPAVLREAREWVRQGKLGLVGFCRIRHAGFLPALRFLLDDTGHAPIIEADPAIPGVHVLGSHATLMVTNERCRLFSERA